MEGHASLRRSALHARSPIEINIKLKRPLRRASTGFAQGLPLVGVKILHRDQRERQSKGYTRHEVTALRAGGPADRPQLFKILYA
jgi:hypothetical protein